MLHECRATHVLWVIWDAKIDGSVIFKFWAKYRPISGQTRSTQVKCLFLNLLTKTCLPCPVLSHDLKKDIFRYDNQKRRKMSFQKVTSSHLYVFYHCSAKNKDIGLKLYIHNVSMSLHILYSVFYLLKIWIKQSTIFEKSNFDSFDQDKKISKSDVVILQNS